MTNRQRSAATNPYAAPNAPESNLESEESPSNHFGAIWFWLIASLLFCFSGTVADPVTKLIGLVNGLLSFLGGAAYNSSRRVRNRRSFRVALAILGIAVAGAMNAPCLIPLVNAPSLFAAWLVYIFASIASGCLAARQIKRGPVRILASFTIGMVLGTLIGGLLGMVGGGVAGTLLADLSLRRGTTGASK